MSKRIIVADDHPLFRDAITHLLERTVADLEVRQVDSFGALTGVLEDEGLPSLVLLDLKLGDTHGMDSLLSLKKRHASLPILIISAYDDNTVIRMAMQYGASGFIPKSLEMDRMAEVITAVLDGDMWFPELMEKDDRSADTDPCAFEELTPTQLRVLNLLREGKPSKEMAAIMSVTEATVKAHLTEIFRKLKVRNRTQAVVRAKELDLPETGVLDGD